MATIDPAGNTPPEAQPAPPPSAGRRRSFDSIFLAAVLFLLTCWTTFDCGASSFLTPEDANRDSVRWSNGLQYAVPLMAILLCHEMGHYLQARRNRVPATLPFFLPVPGHLFGTMGAVIVQAANLAHRRALFDIAVWGPLAGVVIALPVAAVGVWQSQVLAFDPARGANVYGDPLVLKFLVWLRHGPLPPGHDVELNPLLYAGWVGIFLTGLNLLPIGQLDGGHILYALIGRRAAAIGWLTLGLGMAYSVYTSYYGFVPMMILLGLLGIDHPPTADDHVPLGTGRVILGWLTLSFVVIGLTPQPFNTIPAVPAPIRPVPVRPLPELADDETLVERQPNGLPTAFRPLPRYSSIEPALFKQMADRLPITPQAATPSGRERRLSCDGSEPLTLPHQLSSPSIHTWIVDACNRDRHQSLLPTVAANQRWC
jgi:Zn-dependent protease